MTALSNYSSFVSSTIIFPSQHQHQHQHLHVIRRRPCSTKNMIGNGVRNYKVISTRPPATSSSSNIMSTLSIFFDGLMKRYIEAVDPLKPWLDPRHVLSGNFAPVDELPPTECEVEYGSLPPSLDGAYIRNGPNPQFLPQAGRRYHLFDGDGMLHSVRISQGRARLCSRYVKTNKYLLERNHGCAMVPNLFSGFDGLMRSVPSLIQFAALTLTRHLNPSDGIGLANTGLALFGNRLFALYEGDLPYSMRLTPGGDIKTVGRHNIYTEELSPGPMLMTAHPKIDPKTNQAFAFRSSMVAPYITYFYFDPNGRKQPDVPIRSMTGLSYVHDFAITEKYAVFVDIPIEMNALKMILKGGSLFEFIPKKIPRIGILPRYASDDSEIKWFDIAAGPGGENFNTIHAVNAWNSEDGSIVELIAVNAIAWSGGMDMDRIQTMIERVRIDMRTGDVSRKQLSKENIDLVALNPDYIGRRNRYVYASIGDPMPKVTGVVKLDLWSDCVVASRMYGPGQFGSEPFFVAREPDKPDAEEDDGFLVTYIHDEKSGESKFIVMDAGSSELDIVASVKLPQRVPYGFHGLFVKETNLNTI